jgi:hypothetical protein
VVPQNTMRDSVAWGSIERSAALTRQRLSQLARRGSVLRYPRTTIASEPPWSAPTSDREARLWTISAQRIRSPLAMTPPASVGFSTVQSLPN